MGTFISYDDLVQFLHNKGWRHGEPGIYGVLWALGDGEPVGITRTLNSTSPDWRSTFEKIGAAMIAGCHCNQMGRR